MDAFLTFQPKSCQKVCAKRERGFLICLNAASRPAPSRKFRCRVGRLVDRSPPQLAESTCDGRLPAFVRRNRPSGRTSRPSGADRRQTPVRKTPGRPDTPPDWLMRRSAPDKGRQTIIAGASRALRADIGGDPTTKRPTPPNSCDGTGCDAVSNKYRHKVATLCVSHRHSILVSWRSRRDTYGHMNSLSTV